MREPVLRLLTVLSAQPRSRLCRVLATCAGGVVVLGLAPLLLALVGGWAAGRWPSLLPRGLELTFGVLSVLDGLCLVLGLVLGTAYHKGIEEEELRRRFGTEYEAYRSRTPFLFPRLVRPRRHRVSP